MTISEGLCNNRTGGFGPMDPASSLTTTCFNDVVLVPLASFVLILVILPLLIFNLFSPSRSAQHISRPRFPSKWLGILYAVLVAAAGAMVVLEIARLAVAKEGVGLLPVALAGLIYAFGMVYLRYLRRSSSRFHGRGFGMGLLAFWTMLVPFEAVKLARLVQLENVDPGVKGYPSSDKVIDNIVLLGLYVVFLVIETVSLVFGTRKEDQELVKLPEK